MGRDITRTGWAVAAVTACAALLVWLFPASTAMADFKHGRYAGTTDQGTEISFKATKRTVERFSYSVEIECGDGTMREFTSAASAKAPISENGRFTAQFVTPDDSVTSVVDGKLKRRRARGSIETSGTVGAGWECHSSVAWNARHQ